MRYLTVTADYNGTGIKDDFSGSITPESLNLPNHLIVKIAAWCASYQCIIPLDICERERCKGEIEDLDAVGLAIAHDLKSYLDCNVKVKYFSEGKLESIII